MQKICSKKSERKSLSFLSIIYVCVSSRSETCWMLDEKIWIQPAFPLLYGLIAFLLYIFHSAMLMDFRMFNLTSFTTRKSQRSVYRKKITLRFVKVKKTVLTELVRVWLRSWRGKTFDRSCFHFRFDQQTLLDSSSTAAKKLAQLINSMMSSQLKAHNANDCNDE